MDNAEPYDKVGIREAIERDSVEASYMQAMTYINYMYDHLEAVSYTHLVNSAILFSSYQSHYRAGSACFLAGGSSRQYSG